MNTRHLLVLLAPQADPLAAPRLGVVASRKAGNAVVRARCKRLVRELFRLHPEAFPRGVDVVIIVRPGTHLCSLADLEAELAGARSQIARRARVPLPAPARPPARDDLGGRRRR